MTQPYQLHLGDCLEVLAGLPSQTAQTCITSPPYYGLRDYGVDGQIGLEATPEQYIAKLVAVFSEVKRVLRDDGTLWVNIGDSYARNGGGVESRMASIDKMKVGQKTVFEHGGMQSINKVPEGFKSKDLLGIPWMLAFALRADGWYLRQDIIWHKPNPMPESVTDRCTKSHEYIFLLSKRERYYYDHEAIKEGGTARKSGHTQHKYNDGNPLNRTKAGLVNISSNVYETVNKRSVWTVATQPYPEAHFATYPVDLITPCVLAGSRVGDAVLDPFNGSGTTGEAALKFGRRYIGVELNPEYIALSHKRLEPVARQPQLLDRLLEVTQ